MRILNSVRQFYSQAHIVCYDFSGISRLHFFSSLACFPSKHKSRDTADVNFIIEKVGRGSNHDEVFWRLSADEDCQRLQLSSELVTTLLNQFSDDWKSALGVFKWLGSRLDYELTVEEYDIMVDILGKMKQMDQMKALMGEMYERNIVSLTTVGKAMRRLSGAGQWKEAVKLFDKLKIFGLDKNIESMNLLLDTLCKGRKVIQARAIFLDLKDHITPDARTFNILIHGWCKVNRIEEAEWTLQEMKGYGWNPCGFSYSTIILQHCRSNNFVRAFELLDLMETRECPVDVITYTTIMSSLTKFSELDQALQLAERTKKSGCQLDTLFYNSLIHTLGKARRLDEALHIFQVEMPSSHVFPNTSTYNTLIAMFCHQGDSESALNLIEQMKIVVLCKPDHQTFIPLLKLCFRTGKIDFLLMRLLDDMVHKHHLSLNLSTYTVLIHGLCRANKYQWAYELFEELIGKDLKPQQATCRMLLEAVRLKNMNDAAVKIESVMKTLSWRSTF